MDQPISPREEELANLLEWFIAIRWITVIFIITATLVAINLFKISLPVLSIYLITLFIAIYNAVFKIYLKQLRTTTLLVDTSRQFAITQSMLDILSLIAIIHFTGGAENPFIFYFIFHTVLTGMLLSKKDSYIQAVIISVIAVGLFVLEYADILPHHAVKGLLSADLFKNPVYVMAVSFAFTSTILIATFFTVSISERLRLKEKQLKEANLKLLEKDRLKDEYVKMVSHDLKSPLASMLSLLEAVTGGFTGAVDEKAKEILQRIQKKLEFLHHYTKDLLDLSRLRAEKNLNLKLFNVKDVIDTAVEIAMPKMAGKKIQLNVEIDKELPDIEADKEMITYVCLNLIANAFKYTPPGGKVWVKAMQKGGEIAIEVQDTGIGIPSQDLPHIFEEFFRASNVAKTTKGTGLGLSLVKYIIEKHGGNVVLESEVDKGSSFRFTLPMRAR